MTTGSMANTFIGNGPLSAFKELSLLLGWWSDSICVARNLPMLSCLWILFWMKKSGARGRGPPVEPFFLRHLWPSI